MNVDDGKSLPVSTELAIHVIRYGRGGDISARDAVLVLRYAAGLAELNAGQFLAADVNGDGFVDAADAVLILRRVVGRLDRFPVK